MSRVLSLIAAAALVGLAGCATDAARRAAVVSDNRCADFAFPVYFDPRSDGLSTAAAQSISAAVTRTQGCRVASLTVTGVSGDGDPGLARRRADAIAKALVANGLTNPTPIVETEDHPGGLRLLGRRAEVRVHFAVGG